MTFPPPSQPDQAHPGHDPSSSGRRTVLYVLGAVVAVIAVAAAVSFAITGGDDDTDIVVEPDATSPVDPEPPVDPTDAPDPTDPEPEETGPTLPPELQGEVRDVEIEGAPLVRFDPDGPGDPALGERPPTLVGEDATGTVHTISPDIDGPVMLVFLAHWCPACNAEVPHLVDLEEDGRLPDDLTVYGVLTAISPDRPGFPASQWLADFGWPWVSVADGVDFGVDPPQWAAATAFGLSAYPYVVLVDDGVVVDRWVGELGADDLADRITLALD